MYTLVYVRVCACFWKKRFVIFVKNIVERRGRGRGRGFNDLETKIRVKKARSIRRRFFMTEEIAQPMRRRFLMTIIIL